MRAASETRASEIFSISSFIRFDSTRRGVRRRLTSAVGANARSLSETIRSIIEGARNASETRGCA